MKRLLIQVVLAGFFSGCTEELDFARGEYRVIETFLVNNLAADGCSWHFSDETEGSKTLAPTPASQKKIDVFIASVTGEHGMFRIPVVLEYAPEGFQEKVTCGWGHYTEMDAIDIRSLKARKVAE